MGKLLAERRAAFYDALAFEVLRVRTRLPDVVAPQLLQLERWLWKRARKNWTVVYGVEPF